MNKRSSSGVKVLLLLAAWLVAAEEGLAQTGKTVLGKRTQDFIAAFEKGDAKALSEFWTSDGNLIDLTGREMRGRAAIEKHFAAAMASRKGAKLNIVVASTRHITADVALEDGITEVITADGPPSAAQFSAVLVKKNGEWYFESVRETAAQPPSHAKFLEDLEWLYGRWTGEADKGETANVTYEPAENGNFILCGFATISRGVPLVGGTQWIGWDAVDKKIRSWTFYSGGGFSEAVWTKNGNKWSIQTHAKTADGKQVTVTNILTQVDSDNATWQPTRMTVDGKPMPDGPVVKLKRAANMK